MTDPENKNGPVRQAKMPGDPNCPICGGIGWLRQDLPIDHPDFGKIIPCKCRSEEITQSARERLFRMSSLDALKNLTFDNFEKRGRVGLGQQQADSLENAFNQAKQFAENHEGWLLLMGRYGCGKTHLASGHRQLRHRGRCLHPVPHSPGLAGLAALCLFRRGYEL